MNKGQLFETKEFNLKVLSPIHIGTGEDMDPMDYVYKDNKLYRISSDTFFKIVEREGLKEKIIEEDISKLNIKSIMAKLNYIFDVKKDDYIYFINIESELSKDFEKKYFNPDAQMGIGLTLRSGDDVIIPGSSIKGSIRTAFLNLLAERKNEVYDNRFQGRNLMLEKVDEKRLKELKDPLKELKDPINDPFKFVSVADVSVSNETKIVSMIRYGSKKSGIPVTKEIIVPDSKDNTKNNCLTISIKTNLRDRWNNNNNKILKLPKLRDELSNLTLKGLLESTNKFYRDIILKQDRLYYKKYNSNKFEDFFTDIERQKGCLLKLGFGCGNLSYSVRCKKELNPGRTKFLVKLENKELPLGYAILTEK
jgi:CRISPR-associated protein Csm5